MCFCSQILNLNKGIWAVFISYFSFLPLPVSSWEKNVLCCENPWLYLYDIILILAGIRLGQRRIFALFLPPVLLVLLVLLLERASSLCGYQLP